MFCLFSSHLSIMSIVIHYQVICQQTEIVALQALSTPDFCITQLYAEQTIVNERGRNHCRSRCRTKHTGHFAVDPSRSGSTSLDVITLCPRSTNLADLIALICDFNAEVIWKLRMPLSLSSSRSVTLRLCRCSTTSLRHFYVPR